MGLFGDIIGDMLGSITDSAQSASDSKRIEELKPKMMNSALANDFENWFKLQLESSAFLSSQYNFYDDCKRLVIVDNDGVVICFEIEKANVGDECVCNFANTLGYKPLSANGLTYSNGKPATERVLIKAFAAVVKERIKKVLDTFPEEYTFGYSIKYDDGTDKSAGYFDRVQQKAEDMAFGNNSRLRQAAYFTYEVPKQEHKSAF